MITSDDDGATWSEPIDITAQVKADWMCFLGTGPGNAIQLTAPEHVGRILAPVYYSHEAGGTGYLSCAAIYSDDGGTTWTLGASPNDGREVLGAVVHSRNLTDERASLYESVLVEGTDGAVHVWARNQHPSGRVAHAVSHDGGVTWGEVDYDEQLPEIFSSPTPSPSPAWRAQRPWGTAMASRVRSAGGSSSPTPPGCCPSAAAASCA